MSGTFNRILTAIGFVMLLSTFMATYAVTSGKATAMFADAKPTTVAAKPGPTGG